MFILNVCGPVDVSDYVDDVDAMLCIFIPGMEGGHAVADALLGEFSPSGKLPVTFPKHYRDVPSCGNFPGRNKEVWSGEGIFVGYRYYDYRGIEPRYPFVYGLSYTTFHIEDHHSFFILCLCFPQRPFEHCPVTGRNIHLGAVEAFLPHNPNRYHNGIRIVRDFFKGHPVTSEMNVKIGREHG